MCRTNLTIAKVTVICAQQHAGIFPTCTNIAMPSRTSASLVFYDFPKSSYLDEIAVVMFPILAPMKRLIVRVFFVSTIQAILVSFALVVFAIFQNVSDLCHVNQTTQPQILAADPDQVISEFGQIFAIPNVRLAYGQGQKAVLYTRGRAHIVR